MFYLPLFLCHWLSKVPIWHGRCGKYIWIVLCLCTFSRGVAVSDQTQAGFVSGRDSPGCSLQYSHDNTSEDCFRITGLHMACSDSDFSLSLLFIAAVGKHLPLRSLPSSEPWEFFFPSSHPTPKSCLDKCLADISAFLLCSLCNFILPSLFGVLECI